MTVRLHYANRFASAVGSNREELEIDGPVRIVELLQRLAHRHGDAFRQVAFANDGELQPALMICVNDEHLLDPSDYFLRDGDEVMILSAISGG